MRIVDAYLDGYITIAVRNAYINAGKSLNDLIEVADSPPDPAIHDLSMDGYIITDLGAPVLETDSARYSTVRNRVVSKQFGHDDGATTIFTAPIGAEIKWIRLVHTEIWDGTLKIGDAGDDDRLLTDAETPKTVADHGRIYMSYKYAAATAVVATPTGTTGETTVYIGYEIEA